MKRLILTLIGAIALTAASAQIRTAYFMEGSYFRTDMNPALTPERGYVAIPVISGLGIGVSNNFLSVDNMFYKRDGETVLAFDSRVDADEFLGKLPNVGKLGVNVNTNILSVGFMTKKIFWNLGVNLRASVDVTTSKDLFSAVKNFGNRSYDFSSVGFSGMGYGEIYVGASRDITDWITAGVRLKGIIGALNAGGALTSGDIAVTKAEIAGSVRGSIYGSGLLFNSDYKQGEVEDFSQIIADDIATNNIGNGGFAVDLGAEVRLLDDHLRLSLGITDLGFVSWKKGVTNADFGYDFSYRGMNINTGEVDMEVDGKFTLVKPKNYSRRLNTTINIGAEYNILNDWIAFGLLSHTEFRQLYTLSELTASVNFRIGKSLTTTLSHTFCGRNRAGIFGFALNVHTPGLNLFLGTDFIDLNYAAAGEMVVPKYQKSFNMYFGLGFNLGKNKTGK